MFEIDIKIYCRKSEDYGFLILSEVYIIVVKFWAKMVSISLNVKIWVKKANSEKLEIWAKKVNSEKLEIWDKW